MNLPAWPSIIRMFVVPVVIISACGLLSLAFYGRLAAVVSRLRGFQREMLKEQEKLVRRRSGSVWPHRSAAHTDAAANPLRSPDPASIDILPDHDRAVDCLQLDVGSLLVAPAAAFLAALFLVLGLLSRLAGIIAALPELRGALQPVEVETRYVSNAVDLPIAEGLQEAQALMTVEHSSDSSSQGSRP